ncbi:MAG TPA: MFS transporter [Nitrospirota bacterium]|nr:MFS transporter [Nitrospirota bacterium]
MLTQAERKEKLKAIVRVASGNFMEMYDFMVFGYYAIYIAKTFFPMENEYASLMLSLGTFGAGYLMRPLGAIVLGAYIDKHGRRKGLIVTLAMMAVGTFTIAVTPGYSQIGLLAPLIVVLGRLVQGLSAGVELGGVSIYLAEIATPGNRGFYCAWQSASQQIAVMFAAVLGVVLSQLLPPAQMTQWGWRVPLIVGCLIIPLILVLRRSLQETDVFKARSHRPNAKEILRLVAANWQVVLLGAMMSTLTTTCFYLITAYTPTFGKQVLNFSIHDSLLVTLCVGASNFLWLPIGGALSDRIGRRPILYFFTITTPIMAYPAMMWLTSDPSLTRLLIVELYFSCIFGAYNGAMIPYLAEIMPPQVRTAAFALAFSLATAIFGGFTPAVSTFLIHVTGNRATPALWLSLSAILGLIAVVALKKRHATFAKTDAALT